MTQFKDEYKRRNVELVEENSRLKSENSRLFSAAIEERDATIARLEQSGEEGRARVGALENLLRCGMALFIASIVWFKRINNFMSLIDFSLNLATVNYNNFGNRGLKHLKGMLKITRILLVVFICVAEQMLVMSNCCDLLQAS